MGCGDGWGHDGRHGAEWGSVGLWPRRQGRVGRADSALKPQTDKVECGNVVGADVFRQRRGRHVGGGSCAGSGWGKTEGGCAQRRMDAVVQQVSLCNGE